LYLRKLLVRNLSISLHITCQDLHAYSPWNDVLSFSTKEKKKRRKHRYTATTPTSTSEKEATKKKRKKTPRGIPL
jgi:hypothetical protein